MADKKYRQAIIGRLPLYLQFLQTVNRDPRSYISAASIAQEIGLGEVLVRKDLQVISGKGKPRVGYRVSSLTKDIEKALDFNNETKAIVVGAGHLGKALYAYSGFKQYGLKIVAAFDVDANKVTSYSKYVVYPFSELKKYVSENKIKLAILTVPAYTAQFVCDQLVKAGITAIWSFSSRKLIVPSNVVVKHEDLALSLAYLKNQMKDNN